jgi:hypothetical protein
MSTSIIGIILSVSITIVNALFAPERVFCDVIERFENTLELLWNRSSHNMLPQEIKNFDEHKDHIDALAEDELNRELNKIDSKKEGGPSKPWESRKLKDAIVAPPTEDEAKKKDSDAA